MAENLTLQYDPAGDILYIDKRAPYPAQESEEVGDDIIVRLNPETGEVENWEILFFSKRFTEKRSLNLLLQIEI
jgi:uncharacterized protein YuzE